MTTTTLELHEVNFALAAIAAQEAQGTTGYVEARKTFEATRTLYRSWKEANRNIEDNGMAILEAVKAGDTGAYARRMADDTRFKAMASQIYINLTNSRKA